MKVLMIFATSLLFSLTLYAAEKPSYEVTVKGKLVSYNPTTAVVLTEGGTKIRVPRKKVFPKPEGVIVGKGQVLATMSPKEMFALNPIYKKLALKIMEKKQAAAAAQKNSTSAKEKATQ